MQTRSQSSKQANQQVTSNMPAGSRHRITKRAISHKEDTLSEGNNGKACSLQVVQTNRTITSVLPAFLILEITILMEIFRYAAEQLPRQFAAKWLLQTALVCPRFLEPALSVLYYAPSFGSQRSLRKFTTLLSHGSSTISSDYFTKVKYFDIEGSHALKANVVDILGYFPTLRGVGKSPYQDKDFRGLGSFPPTRTPKRLLYTHELFQSMLKRGISLSSWTWNFFLDYKAVFPWLGLEEIHGGAYFRNLRVLALNNYDGIPDSKSLASAICAIPTLVELLITVPLGLSDEFWPALPATLQSLKLFGTTITSDQLLSYLQPKGHSLRELVLEKNTKLTMDFCSHFAIVCSKMMVFYFDNSFTSSSTFSGRSENPLFLQTNTPTWPSMLQELILTNLSKLNSELAEVLFQSVIAASSSLSDLRKLSIKASVDMPHRERARFRQHWVETFNTVYLRKCDDPSPDFYSYKTFAASKIGTFKQPKRTIAAPPTNTRRSSRRAEGPSSPSSFSQPTNANTPTTNESSLVVHGLCSVVDIRIDNERGPGVARYKEVDFLDAETDGDSDWDGDDIEDDTYAW